MMDVVGGRRFFFPSKMRYTIRTVVTEVQRCAPPIYGFPHDGLFERNLVMCTRNFSGGTRIGLSLGGGGTAPQFCEDGSCNTEHQNGILRNNLIVNCSDVGIYLNRAQDTLVDHNTLYATAGIDVRFPTSSATLRPSECT